MTNVALVQVFGNSPDETAYVRLALNRETVPDAIVMIQPVLQAYNIHTEGPEPVCPDACCGQHGGTCL